MSILRCEPLHFGNVTETLVAIAWARVKLAGR